MGFARFKYASQRWGEQWTIVVVQLVLSPDGEGRNEFMEWLETVKTTGARK